ncbi:protein of unknown function [Methanoculleus bourgensis]|jgi:hypothetical protein|uniref:Uncharacterized protein n=1 Tax=Methanoculleus bourgensis TaxID=83986 RepID=A0A0X3BMR8_9EURY|nr:protein of unknown function [Methanoculleus bourgensis]
MVSAGCMPVAEKQGYANGTEYSQERKDSGAYPNLFYIHLITSKNPFAFSSLQSKFEFSKSGLLL